MQCEPIGYHSYNFRNYEKKRTKLAEYSIKVIVKSIPTGIYSKYNTRMAN